MSDGSAVRRSLTPRMTNEYMKELFQHMKNGTISAQDLSQAKSNPMLSALLGESLDTNTINCSGRDAALIPRNRNRPRPEINSGGINGYSPTEVMALVGALKKLEGPVSADGWPIDANDATYTTAISWFSQAYHYFEQQEYYLAAKDCMGVMRYLLGSDHPLPGDNNGNGHGVETPTYCSLSIHRRHLLVQCCTKLAMCYLKREGKDIGKALAWLNEAEVIAKNRQYSDSSSHVWIQPTSPTLVDIALIECLTTKINLLDEIGNSSAYQHASTLLCRFVLTLPPWNQYAGRSDSLWVMSAVFNNGHKNKSGAPPLSQRHPDPESDQRYQIIDPNLQVRGAWKKESIKKEELEGLSPITYGESAFIWGGYLYVVRAKNTTALIYIPEIRRISLKERNKWEHVTTFPAARRQGFSSRVCIDGHKLYALSEQPQLDIFNLSTNKWTSVKTIWKPTADDRRIGLDFAWPWLRRNLFDGVTEIVNDRLYFFGGYNGLTFTGCNLFMELDLKTLKWRRLSGAHLIDKYNPHVPGPRIGSGSWVSPDNKKLYIFSGICQKARTGLMGARSGPSDDWMYDDLWSWDTETEKWTEERMQGNCPSPRAAMGFAFSKKLNAFIVFGGENSLVSTKVGDTSKSAIHSGIYADTYMWISPSPPKPGSTSSPGHWKQIQTVGFPTYRTSCHLVIDPDTEDIYLYGGHVAGDSIPSKTRTEEQRSKRKTHESLLAAQLASSPLLAQAARKLELDDLCATSYTVRFGDLWKLHVDVPGGGFEAINMEDELRTAALGPWQRCFECRRVGFWKKCGGSCSGNAFFCSTDCPTKGWKVHKKLNGCRKIA